MMNVFNWELQNFISCRLFLLIVCVSFYLSISDGHEAAETNEIVVDENGYVLFCLCMGKNGF